MYLFHMGNMSVPQSVFVKNDTAGLFMEELFSVFTAFHIANKVAWDRMYFGARKPVHTRWAKDQVATNKIKTVRGPSWYMTLFV